MSEGRAWPRYLAAYCKIFSPLLCSLVLVVFGLLTWTVNGIRQGKIMLPAETVAFQDYATSAKSAAFVADDYQTRVLWGIAFLLTVLASLVAVGLGAGTIVRALKGERWLLQAIFCVLLLGSILVARSLMVPHPRGGCFLSFDAAGTVYFPVIDAVLQRSLANPAYLSVGGLAIPRVMGALAWLINIAAALLGLGYCGILLRALRPHRAPCEDDLRPAMERSKWLLYCSSGLLVCGISVITAFYVWPVIFVPAGTKASAANTEAIKSVASMVSLAGGSVYSLLTLAGFLPTAYYLRRCAETLADRRGAAEDRDKWLEENGLAFSPLQELKPIVAVLGPLLAGGSASALIKLFFGSGG